MGTSAMGGLSLYTTNQQEFMAKTDFGYQPDVAGIGYDTSVVGVGSPTDKALIVYANTSVNTAMSQDDIWRTDWYPIIPAPGGWAGTNRPSYYTPDVSIDHTAHSTGQHHFAHPRIDANDDHGTNLGSGIAVDQWKIVYESQPSPGSNTNIKSASDMTLPVNYSNWIDLTSITTASVVTSSYDHFCPTVAYGVAGYNGLTAVNDTQYMVSMDTHVPGYGEYNMMVPIEVRAPTVIVPDPSTVQNYFLVNTTYPEDMASANYGNAVSTPVNNVVDTATNTWAIYNPGSGNYEIYYKHTPNTLTGTGYAYKHPSGAATLPKAVDMIQVYPNPANDHITISNPTGVAADRYTVTDMLGRHMAGGSMVTGSNTVAVERYAPGDYVLTLYKSGGECGSHVFTKN